MRRFLNFIFFVLLAFSAYAKGGEGAVPDTTDVIKFNKQGYDIRMTNPEQTLDDAGKALTIAKRLDYKKGIGEAYRVIGIGYYYLNQPVKAIDNYLAAINYFTQIKDIRSEAKVYNNIGVLYRDNDHELALEFFQKSLTVATQLHDNHLIASLYLNIGETYFRKKSYYQALNYDDKSGALFAQLKDSVNMIVCMQNKGLVYYKLNQYDQAESLLSAASQGAKKLDLNESVASIDLTLAALYIDKNDFKNAEQAVQEGVVFSGIIKDEKLMSDFKYTSYQLELKRKNYGQAVADLYQIYKQDSTTSMLSTSNSIALFREQVNQQARQRENEFLLQRQQYDRVKFFGVAVVAGLLLVLVGVLISNVKRKARTNSQLTNLNAEVSRQKDNLDRINHHLEEIIDERTKDLQVKNKKLSEHSSYLSHQIRGPIATLKGLMNLEKEGLVDQPECIKMMNKCVSEIDDKIMEMSEMLHDPRREGF